MLARDRLRCHEGVCWPHAVAAACVTAVLNGASDAAFADVVLQCVQRRSTKKQGKKKKKKRQRSALCARGIYDATQPVARMLVVMYLAVRGAQVDARQSEQRH